MNAPLSFGNHQEKRWCKKGMHYVDKRNGAYVPTTPKHQEWCCNTCIRRQQDDQRNERT